MGVNGRVTASRTPRVGSPYVCNCGTDEMKKGERENVCEA